MAKPQLARRRGRSSRGTTTTTRTLWWSSPAGVLTLIVPISLGLAVRTSDLTFRQLYRTPKTLSTPDAKLLLLAGALLLVGAMLPLALRGPGRPGSGPWPDFEPDQLRLLRRASTVCFRLTIVGYAAFLLAGVARGARPATLLTALTSQNSYSGTLKQTFAPVTGITTLTQVGMAYVVLAGLLLAVGDRRGIWRRVAVVLVLATARTFFLTERLAILEIVVPFALLLAVGRYRRSDRSWALPFAPAFAFPALVVVFGAFEYSRSWTFFRSRTTSTFPQFVLDRLAGYYSTAYNNSAISLHHEGAPGRLPYSTLEGLWTAPGISQLHLYDRFSTVDAPSQYALLLKQYGTPEFNNPGGLATPLVDFGVHGGLVVMLVVGVLIGFCYRSFRGGGHLGMLLYPLVFTGLLELPRYFYWGQGRLVPAVVALVVVAVKLRRRPSPAPVPASLHPLESSAPANSPTAPDDGPARPDVERSDQRAPVPV